MADTLRAAGNKINPRSIQHCFEARPTPPQRSVRLSPTRLVTFSYFLVLRDQDALSSKINELFFGD